MATKGERTRQMIVERSAELFNVNGYAGTSMSDIIAHVGIKKGGIYRYFDSKEQIALEAFDYAMRLRTGEIERIVASTAPAPGRLNAIAQTFLALIEAPVIPGGCPIMNAAIEADDAYPLLREQAQAGAARLHGAVAEVVRQGLAAGELHPATSPDVVATVLVAAGEGALMLTKLSGSSAHLHRTLGHLKDYVVSLQQQ